MLEIKINCKCKICGEPVEIKSHGVHDLYHMQNNKTRETPFFAYHHEGFGDDRGLSFGNCGKCGAIYSIDSDVISVICRADGANEEFFKDMCPEPDFLCSRMTFPKWLKGQQGRCDVVGDLAKRAFYTDGHSREYKKQLDREQPGRPERATDREEWITYLGEHDPDLTGFYMAWAEYQFLKRYCRLW